jgi:hypothetical protein
LQVPPSQDDTREISSSPTQHMISMPESEFTRILERTVKAALAKLEFKCGAKLEDVFVERNRLQKQLSQATHEVDSLRGEHSESHETLDALTEDLELRHGQDEYDSDMLEIGGAGPLHEKRVNDHCGDFRIAVGKMGDGDSGLHGNSLCLPIDVFGAVRLVDCQELHG